MDWGVGVRLKGMVCLFGEFLDCGDDCTTLYIQA